MISAKKDYILYKNFLKKFKPYYNVFFLADLMHWVGKATFLNAEQIKKRWGEHIQLIKSKKVNDVLNFYIHIPFCKSRCSYCMYYSKTINQKELEFYIDKLIKEMSFFKKTFSQRKFSSLYFGGGTPSVLSEKQINKLFSALFGSFNFKKDGEKTFECNPESTTFKKLKLLKKFGFNRVSFGVQNLDKKVLSFTNRDYQNYNHIKKIVKNAKSFGFEVNTDIMIGLKSDNIKSIIDSFVKLAKIRPDTITLYPLKPPKEYLRKYFNNDYYSFNFRLYRKAEKVRRQLKLMEGVLNYCLLNREFEIYTASEPVFYSKNFKAPYHYDYDYTSSLNYPKPCSLFALGTRASSYIFNSLQYHDAATGKESADFNPKEKNYWAIRFNLKDEMRYFILQQLSCKLCFSQKEFREFFNSDFKVNFKGTINSLKKLDKIKFDGDLVFLPSEPLERYTCSLFFFDKKKVIKKINDFLMSAKYENN